MATAAVLCGGGAGIDPLLLHWEDDVLGTRVSPLHEQAFSDELDNRVTELADNGGGGAVELARAVFDVSLLGLPVTVQGADADYTTAASSLNSRAGLYAWYDGGDFAVAGR